MQEEFDTIKCDQPVARTSAFCELEALIILFAPPKIDE